MLYLFSSPLILEQGNLAFKESNYPLALAHYTTALQQDPSEFTYPLNRALVYLKLEQSVSACSFAPELIQADQRVMGEQMERGRKGR